MNEYFEKCDAAHKAAKAFFTTHKTLEGAPHGTPRSHYEKYQGMCKASGLAIGRVETLGLKDIDDLTRRYLSDRTLCNISLRRVFDPTWASYRAYNPRPPRGAARTPTEYTCCMKWLLVYAELKMVPEFIDD